MTLSKKTKEELVSEVKKLQKKIESLQKKKVVPQTPVIKDPKWESLFKHSSNFIMVLDKKGNIIDINRVVKGLKKEKVIGSSVYDFVEKESQQNVKKVINALFKTGKPQQYTTKGLGNNGHKAYYSCKATPVIENKKVIAAIIDTTDITNEARIQNTIKQNEEKFKKLSDAAFEGIVIHQEGKVAEINKAICRIFGYKEKEIIGKSIFHFIHPDYHSLALEKLKNKDENQYEMMMLRKGNKPFWAELMAGELTYSGSSARVAAIRDVTAAKEYEKKIKDSEEKFRMLAENATDVVYRFRVFPKTEYEYVSPSVFYLTGYKPENFYTDPYLGFKLIHPDDVYLLGDSEKLIKQKAALSNIKAPEMVLRWIKKDGTVIWTETRNKPIINEHGKLIAVEGISRDITLQKNSEDELKDSEERFKLLSNATFEGIVFSENGKIIDANDQFVKMYGYTSSDEFIGKHIIDDFIVEEQRSMARRFVRLSKSEPFEVQTIRKDGTLITVETKGQNIPYFGKNIRATVIYNITERKRYEFSLRESERTLSTLMNNLPGMAYQCNYDDKWTMRFVSKGFQELTGYHPKDIVANKKRAFADIIHPDDRDLGMEQIRNAIKTQSPFEIEYRIINANGEAKWVWEKGEGVFSDEGKLLFLEGFITDINDKKQYELEITQSRENYKSLVDSSPDGVFIHIDGKVVFANPSALKLAGIQIQETETAFSFSLFDFLLPEYHAEVVERIKKAIAGESQSFIEVKIRSLTGEIKEVETKPILIKFNGHNAVLTVAHDISTQKQLLKEQARAQIAEETNELLEQEITQKKITQLQLQESQKYTRLLISSSLDMICASDKNGYITEFNKAAQQTFGYTEQEAIGKHVSILYANPEERIRITNEELYSKGVFAGEVVNLKKNGEQFVAYLSASLLKNEEGEAVGAMGVSRDISELKKSEEQLRTQSAKLNSVFESSSHVICTVDKKFCLTSFNKNFTVHMRTRYGVEPQIGLSMVKGDAVSNEEYNKYWINKYEQVLNGNPQYFETKLIDKYSNLVWREIYLNPIIDEKGRVVEVSGIGHDITEKKLADEKVHQSLQEKEVLLKEVHHRVKNNLQVISSILNLQSSYVKDVSTLNILKESQNRIKSMAFIHESLYQTKDFSSINFSEYVINLSQNLIHSYSNFENEIKLNLDIQNVFLNLDLAIPCGLIINEIVSNALKYAFVDTKDDGEITITMEADDQDLKLIIGDNGIGLPEHIDYRNTESLGLQLVVTLTDQLNGTIDLDTTNGTTYTIIFKQNQVKNRI